MPYSCHDQFGTSGNSGCPIGGLSATRGIAFSIRHSSTFRMTQTAGFLPPGSLSFGRSIRVGRECDQLEPRLAFFKFAEDSFPALEEYELPALTRGMTFSAIRIIDCRPSSR